VHPTTPLQDDTKELEMHKTFFSTFLSGISSRVDESGAGRSSLSVLNQGAETALGYKKLTAQYLDVPTGKRLRLLRHAHRNLTVAMKEWYPR